MRWLALALVVCLGGCPATGPGARDGKTTAVLRIECPVADATLWIDGQMVAQVRDVRGGIRLRAGDHLVEVRHDHYHTRYLELTFTPGETRVVAVTLAEALP